MFSQKLTEARKNKGYTQEQLAEKLYLTRQAVSRWERGTSEPDLQTLGRICGLLGVTADYLIGGGSVCDLTVFKKLPWREKHILVWQFISKHKGLYILTSALFFLSFICLDCALFFFAQLVMHNLNLIQYPFNANGAIALILGLIVPAVLFMALGFYFRTIFSTMFNKWLFEKNILRTSKIL